MEGDETIEQRRELFYARREATIKEMEQLQDTLDMLTYKCWFYDVAAQKGTTEAPHTMSYEEMPKEIAQLSLRLNKQHPKIKALDEAS